MVNRSLWWFNKSFIEWKLFDFLIPVFFNDWPSNSLNTIYKDDDLFYIGSSGGGFFSFNYEFGIQNTNTFNTENSGLINDYVLCIEKDKLGYWIGTEGGFSILDWCFKYKSS